MTSNQYQSQKIPMDSQHEIQYLRCLKARGFRKKLPVKYTNYNLRRVGRGFYHVNLVVPLWVAN